jgi:hypothetical protein
VNKSEEQEIRKIRGEWISQKNKKLERLGVSE